ncbi:MAG: hypothetical protein JXB38_15380 [Anaerolineales bacterium]|nr:hypothetical protein [Anaerolineales bacterium]
MHSFRTITFGVLLSILLAISLLPTPALANETTNRNSELNFGARLNLPSDYTALALQTATEIDLDWIAVDFDWDAFWPGKSQGIKYQFIDPIMEKAATNDIAVLISITNAPNWAMTETGPDPELTAELVTILTNRYGRQALSAIELFPGANTVSGWGVSPNPGAYLALLKCSQASMRDANTQLTLVAGGLMPVSSTEPRDWDDLAFLEALYENNAMTMLPVISLRLTNITHSANAVSGEYDAPVLRHYEDIRNLMLKHEHQTGKIWITGFSWPDDQPNDPDQQAGWLAQAYDYMSAQLYIELCIFNSLNTAEAQSTGSPAFLVNADGALHPAAEIIRERIRQQYDYATRRPKYAEIQSLASLKKENRQ